MQPLFSNAYVQDILHQPAAVRDTLASLAGVDFAAFQPLARRLASGALRRVVLTGMGSSFHALQPLLFTLLESGAPAILIETSELVHHAPRLLAPDSLIVAVSQSGRSAEMLRLAEKAARETAIVAVTNTASSPLANSARAVLLTRAGEENSVSCKTYVVALAALACLGELLLGRPPARVLTDLQPVPETVATYLSGLEGYLANLGSQLRGVRHVIIAGRGASLAAAGTGGLILKEAAHAAAEGMSCASFRHGPMELVSPEVFVMVYEGSGATRALNAGLAHDVLAAGGRSALVALSPEPGVFHLQPVPAVGLPILEILPAQLLSVALALQSGREPGVFTRGTKVTTVE
jgi:glucosamine--fructose-6-phosphate aminotransferase (isomerizing)